MMRFYSLALALVCFVHIPKAVCSIYTFTSSCDDRVQGLINTNIHEINWHVLEPIKINITLCDAYSNNTLINFESDDKYVASVKGNDFITNGSSSNNIIVSVYARNLGYANISAYATFGINKTVELLGIVRVAVLQRRTILNRIFVAVASTFMIIINFVFGCRISLSKLKDIFKTPVAPAIGLSCQLLLMPTVSLNK